MGLCENKFHGQFKSRFSFSYASKHYQADQFEAGFILDIEADLQADYVGEKDDAEKTPKELLDPINKHERSITS